LRIRSYPLFTGMIKKALNRTLAVLAIIVGLYPFIYFFVDRKFGLLQSKTEAILGSTVWNIEFYTHITLGGIALLIGWTQFKAQWRIRWLTLHRQLGKLYVIAALFSALAGIYIAFYATGGMIASLGFICLGVIWFYSTLRAYLEIRRGRIEAHQKMMIYSYAACLSAVTLRIYLPLLTMLFHDFIKGYLVVAWLCWVPNIIVAWFLVRRVHAENNQAVLLAPND
jgi:uncharacterized membrane protein